MTVEQKLAARIIKKLRRKNVHVLSYHSRSSRSVYLKFDFGVAFSLRIADHVSNKHHLSYRYNLLTKPDPRAKKEKHFYHTPGELNNLVYKILHERSEKIAKYGEKNYRSYMNMSSEKLKNPKSGFWKFCHEET